MQAYLRRKRFEAKLMVAAVGEGMFGNGGSDRIPPHEMFGMLGISI